MKRLTIAVLMLFALSAMAEPAKLKLSIDGMDCGGCAKGIEAMLERLDGVLKASVSFEASEGIVEYDSAKVTAEMIVKEIEELGYKVTVKK
jgi:copper chaperone CopZ